MFNWVWDQPVNGWEFVWSTLIGVIVTIGSVYIGIRSALRGEHVARAEFRNLKQSLEDEGVATALVVKLRPQLEAEYKRLMNPNPPKNPMDGDIAWGLSTDLREKEWRPLRMRAVLRQARDEMPESHMEIVNFLDRLQIRFEWVVDNAETSGGSGTNGLISGEASIIWGRIHRALDGFVDKSIPLNKFHHLDE